MAVDPADYYGDIADADDYFENRLHETDWNGTILEGIAPGSTCYFVHSFTAEPTDDRYRLADCDYDGRVISAAVRRGNLYGCQFHPEKSGEAGLRIIKNFLAVL